MRRALAHALVALCCASTLPGCLSILFAPGDELVDGGGVVDAGDAGVDAWVSPRDAGDAGRDSGRDAGPVCERRESACTGGEDEDCDGLVDCRDFDCARTIACCTEGSEIFTEQFSGTAPGWNSLPAGHAPAIAPSGGRLDDLGREGVPRALARSACVPVDLGVRITATLSAAGGSPVCPVGVTCPNYAALVLTADRDMILGRGLADDLAVRLHHDGRLRITQAGADLIAPVNMGAGPVAISIDLTPGTDEEGVEYVFAYVNAVGASTVTYGTASEPAPLIPREYLVGDALGCNEASGLYVAVEGIGTRNYADDISARIFECANPSHFAGPLGTPTELDASDLRLAARWTAGGIGAPTLESYFEDDTAVVPSFEILVDGTNGPRASLAVDVRTSVGGSRTLTDARGLTGWNERLSATTGGLILGLLPPECAMGDMPIEGCGALRGVREPDVLVPVDETSRERPPGGVVHPLVVAHERAGARGVFDIAFTSLPLGLGGVAPLTTLVTAGAAPITECVSLRDPALLPIGPGEAPAGYFVLFTCEREGMPSIVRAVRTNSDLGALTFIPEPVLTPTSLGNGFAERGVYGADGVAFFDEAGSVTYRLWFMARDRSERSTIGFAEGSGPRGMLPAFRGYVANPVLVETDAVLGDCPIGRCALESVAVARWAADATHVRLLVTRQIQEAGMATRYVMVPLDQVWPR